MKGEEGVWGALAPLGGTSPPEANRMERSQIRWKLLLFDESDFLFLLRPVYFLFFFNRAMLLLLYRRAPPFICRGTSLMTLSLWLFCCFIQINAGECSYLHVL